MKTVTRYLISFLIGIFIAFTTKISLLNKFILIVLVVLICQIIIDYVLKKKGR